MYKKAKEKYEAVLGDIRADGLWKDERIITTQQQANIDTTAAKNVLNLCANNYLGMANDERLIEAGKRALDEWGFGMSSVRFICGTQALHKELERRISGFLETDDTILYSSCFDANGGLFETLLGPEDAVISDELNHASIIDGIRLCGAMKYRYKNNDMEDLEAKLKEADAAGAKVKMIATDGVFSMDGFIANLKAICDLADMYDALVMVDDSHATGFVGDHGKGTQEHCGVMGRVDVITGTLGKALGGATGGFTSGRKEIIDLLRQRSRPYLFSNSVAPVICGAAIEMLDILEESTEKIDKLRENQEYFRRRMREEGFVIPDGEHPIIPVMFGDNMRAQKMADALLEKGIYVVGFFYPVVPMGKARIRTQMSAVHTKEDLDRAVAAFVEAGNEVLEGDFGMKTE